MSFVVWAYEFQYISKRKENNGGRNIYIFSLFILLYFVSPQTQTSVGGGNRNVPREYLIFGSRAVCRRYYSVVIMGKKKETLQRCKKLPCCFCCVLLSVKNISI